MDFALNEEQRMFLDLFEDFAAKEVAPVAEETDREETLPPELLRKAAAQGFLGATLPEDYGGAALDSLSYCLLLESLARHCLSTAITLASHVSLAGTTILLGGSPAQKERFLPALAAGEAIGCYLLNEPEAGGDPRALTTFARREGDGYTLNGLKTWGANAGIAGLFVALAKTGPRETDLSAFVIERGAPGLTVGYREPTLGLRGVPFNTVYLEDCRSLAENRLGDEGGAGPLVAAVSTHLRLALAAAALGAAESALDLGMRFAVERKQFGVSIATKGAMQTYFADTMLDIESLRHLVGHAAWLAGGGQAYGHAANLARLKGGQVARDAANKMLQVHGGYGFSDEYTISRIHRDVRALRLMGGSDEALRPEIALPELARLGLPVAAG